MDKRYNVLAGGLETMTADIKRALEGIGLVNPLVSIELVNMIGSEHTRRSLSPIVDIRAHFWEDDMCDSHIKEKEL
jgi:hypothetical protein